MPVIAELLRYYLKRLLNNKRIYFYPLPSQQFYLFLMISIENDKFKLRRLFKEADGDFNPPLSERYKDIDGYINKIEEGQALVYIKNGKFIGFISFCWKEDHYYVDTLYVNKEFRKQGVAEELYNELFKRKKEVRLRTWSSNEKHIELLYKLKFKVYKRIKNDRDNGDDSIYFSKK
jgi:ribosomal protein S18 acetylase RimI-like enzyme